MKVRNVRQVLADEYSVVWVNREDEGGWISQYTIYTFMKIEQWSLLKSFEIEGEKLRENGGKNEPNQGTL
jgi:hypothetical protein